MGQIYCLKETHIFDNVNGTELFTLKFFKIIVAKAESDEICTLLAQRDMIRK